MKSQQIAFAFSLAVLVIASNSSANTLLFLGHGQPSPVTLDDSASMVIERPRINDSAEVVWAKYLIASGKFAILSNTRGEIASSATTIRDPDINDSGEIIWRFGDGSAGPNGIQSNVRGTLLLSSSQDPRYDSQRINSSGEVIAVRSGEELWSSTRGFLPSFGELVREPEFNDSGEIVYYSHFQDRNEVRSTVKGQLSNVYYAHHPDINNSGEVVWQQISGPLGTIPEPKWEIWSSVRGKLGNGVNPSINDSGEVVWQIYDGDDFEIYSSVRGQLTSDLKMDTDPVINNAGDITWLRLSESVPEPSMALLLCTASMIGWAIARPRE
jgi:hypothetical protein